MSALNSAMDRANNEIIDSLVAKLARSQKRLDLIAFRAKEGKEIANALYVRASVRKRDHDSAYFAAIDGLRDILQILESDDI